MRLWQQAVEDYLRAAFPDRIAGRPSLVSAP